MHTYLWGNFVGASYFLIFQMAGILIAFRIFGEEKSGFKILAGSVLGSFLLQWIPAVLSLGMGFGLLSHTIAGVIILLIAAFLWITGRKENHRRRQREKQSISIVSVVMEHKILILIGITFLYFCLVLLSHTIPVKNGAMYTGQCTYGDINGHMGFMTSIAVQGTFPPEYSILPGVRLCYPFLSDSISSSIYIWGASLRYAYILPMLFAALQVFFGLYCFFLEWLKNKSKAVVAFILFIFNGGFGFAYFLDGSLADKTNFTRIFTEFYQTPTNLIGKNIRWTNVLVDMLIPQRATLFGWAVFFTVLLILFKAWKEGKRTYFITAGILAGGLPMIHTHSFMALGIICAGWLLARLYEMAEEDWGMDLLSKISRYLIPIAICGMSAVKILSANKLIDGKLFLIGAVAILLIVTALGIQLFIKAMRKGNGRELLQTWGIFLAIVLALAVPQLLTWTFRQVGSGGYIKGYFNWSNESDYYLWFYLKNMGLTMILAIPALWYSRKKDFMIVFPALLMWMIAELVVFQPNVYDNNKLLLAAYFFFCGLTAGYMIDIYEKLKGIPGRRFLATLVMLCCTLSALLTMGREYVSEYELYSSNQLALCEYIEENAEKDATFLTNTRHNNAISSLTGRNIVCGSSSYLYFHGLDYQGREEAVRDIYMEPERNLDKIAQYQVDYILIGPDERYSYQGLDEVYFRTAYECIFQINDVYLYKIVY